MPQPSYDHTPIDPAANAGEAFVAAAQNPAERAAQELCEQVLLAYPGYEGTFSFGTPGGNDLDLRLCFNTLDDVPQDEIRQLFQTRLPEMGIDTEVDLLFMTNDEFVDGIRDLVELEEVEKRLRDGFDPHVEQAAVGDMSMFSLYIFSTMRVLHRNVGADGLLTPQSALDRLVLTRDGAVGWMHYYAGCFLHEYIQYQQTPGAQAKYRERLAKFFSRVAAGSTLAGLEPPQLVDIKPEMIDAIRGADAEHSTDAQMTGVLLTNPHTRVLLDMDSRQLLLTSGDIRSGKTEDVSEDYIATTEAALFFHAAQQGAHRRVETGEEADPLTSYALGELIRDLGERVIYAPGAQLMAQGDFDGQIVYIPLKTRAGQNNASVEIIVRGADGEVVAEYLRTPGRVVGEGAIFGLPRSATVTAQGDVDAYVINADTIRAMLTDEQLREQLQQPVLQTKDARRLDVLLRYFAREAAIFVRQTLPYTTLAERDAAEASLGGNPLAGYNLGQKFHDVLALFNREGEADSDSSGEAHVIAVATTEQPQTLFETGETTDRLYVVSSGTVTIPLRNGNGTPEGREVVTLHPGEFFGESALLGLDTTGAAVLSENSSVLAVDAEWFKRFSQSRQPIQGIEIPSELQGILPIHLLYHLAAEGYDRVRRRLSTQGRAG